MLFGVRFFKILAELLKLNRVLSPKLLHLKNSFTLVDNEFLVPDSYEGFELGTVLMLDVELLSLMFFN